MCFQAKGSDIQSNIINKIKSFVLMLVAALFFARAKNLEMGEKIKIFTFQCDETSDYEIYNHIPLPHHSTSLVGKYAEVTLELQWRRRSGADLALKGAQPQGVLIHCCSFCIK